MKSIIYTPAGGNRVQVVAADKPRVVDDGAGGTRLETETEIIERIAAQAVPAGLSYTIVDVVPPLDADLIAEKNATVDVELARRMNGGFVDTITGKTWQCREKDLPVWTAIGSSSGMNVLRGGAAAETTYDLIAADNDTVTLAAADANALLEGRILAWVSASKLRARAMKNEIALLSGDAIAAYDISVGWP